MAKPNMSIQVDVRLKPFKLMINGVRAPIFDAAGQPLKGIGIVSGDDNMEIHFTATGPIGGYQPIGTGEQGTPPQGGSGVMPPCTCAVTPKEAIVAEQKSSDLPASCLRKPLPGSHPRQPLYDDPDAIGAEFPCTRTTALPPDPPAKKQLDPAEMRAGLLLALREARERRDLAIYESPGSYGDMVAWHHQDGIVAAYEAVLHSLDIFSPKAVS